MTTEKTHLEVPARLHIGDTIRSGQNSGWLYCATKTGKSFLVAPTDSGVMKWREAMAYAAHKTATLPEADELEAIYEARNTGAFKGTFATDRWSVARYWTATQIDTNYAWCHDFRTGGRVYDSTSLKHSVRCIRPCTLAYS